MRSFFLYKENPQTIWGALHNKSRFKTKIQNGFLYVYFAMFIIRFFFRLAYSKALAAPPQEYLT